MIGDYRHLVTFQEPSDPVPDGVGGYTQTWQNLTPATWQVQIVPAASTDQQRVSSGTVLTAAISTVRGRRHPGVSTRARMLFNGKTYMITAATDLDVRSPTMELTAVEQGTP